MKIFDYIFYNSAKVLIRLFFKIFYDLKIENVEAVPKEGAILLVGNHTSWIDTIILAAAIDRIFWFVTGDFILDVHVMRHIVKHLFIIPMRRNHGKEGMEEAISKLKNGEAVCIFPEGAITPDGNIHRFRNGVSIIQKSTQVPIVPFYLDGAVNVWSMLQKKPLFFKKIRVTFGEPFYPSKEKENEIAQELQDKVLELK